MNKEINIVPIRNFKDLKREFGDVEGMLNYMHSTLNCDIKLKGDKVQLEYPISYEHILKTNTETVKTVLRSWKQTYIDKLLRMQYTMSRKYEEAIENNSLAWEKDMVSDTMFFHYIESIFITQSPNFSVPFVKPNSLHSSIAFCFFESVFLVSFFFFFSGFSVVVVFP